MHGHRVDRTGADGNEYLSDSEIYGAAPRCGAGSGPPGFGPPPRSSSPLSSSIFRTRQPSPPALDGATVTTIFVPYCSASTERFLVQPFLSNCEGLGSNSPLQCVTVPWPSVT